MNAHDLARTIAEAMDDPETPTWTTEDTGLSKTGLKQHAADPDYCVSYVTIDGDTYSLVVQRVD